MKKLATVFLLVMAGCHRQAAIGSPEANAVGAATPREAVQRFMAAAKAQDLQALANVWGTTGGPIHLTIGKDELEKRALIVLRYLKHDSYRILSDSPAPNGERIFALEIKYKDLTRVANFIATLGPANRWYLRQFDSEALRDIAATR